LFYIVFRDVLDSLRADTCTQAIFWKVTLLSNYYIFSLNNRVSTTFSHTFEDFWQILDQSSPPPVQKELLDKKCCRLYNDTNTTEYAQGSTGLFLKNFNLQQYLFLRNGAMIYIYQGTLQFIMSKKQSNELSKQ